MGKLVNSSPISISVIPAFVFIRGWYMNREITYIGKNLNVTVQQVKQTANVPKILSICGCGFI